MGPAQDGEPGHQCIPGAPKPSPGDRDFLVQRCQAQPCLCTQAPAWEAYWAPPHLAPWPRCPPAGGSAPLAQGVGAGASTFACMGSTPTATPAPLPLPTAGATGPWGPPGTHMAPCPHRPPRTFLPSRNAPAREIGAAVCELAQATRHNFGQTRLTGSGFSQPGGERRQRGPKPPDGFCRYTESGRTGRVCTHIEMELFLQNISARTSGQLTRRIQGLRHKGQAGRVLERKGAGLWSCRLRA